MLGLLLAILGGVAGIVVLRSFEAAVSLHPCLSGATFFVASVIAVLAALTVYFWQCARRRSLDAEHTAETLRRIEDRFQAAVRGANDGVWDYDFKTNSLYFSPRAKQLIGYDETETVDFLADWETRVHPEDRERIWQAIHAHIEAQVPYDVEYRVILPAGEIRWLRGRGQAVLDPQGTPIRMAGTLSDVTDRKRAEGQVQRHTEALTESNRLLRESAVQIERQAAELQFQATELARAKQEADQANASKSIFLANMSHEIRTPMAAILGFVDLLMEDLNAPRPAGEKHWKQSLQTIKRNGEHLLTIINDILDLSKIESGQLLIGLEDCSIAELMNDVASLMKNRADHKGLSLTVAYAQQVPATIKSDPTRLRQILLNVVGNAVKFTNRGSVTIEVSLAIIDSAECLQFDVVDTGIGLTQEQIGRLFQPFVQADDSTARRFGGTGLGLTISKRLAGMLGGDITVLSQPGLGSRFSITVATGSASGPPIVPNAPELSVVQPRTDLNAVQLQGRILLAEDGLDNQRLITLLLRKVGLEVIVAENGEQAIHLARAAWRDEETPDGQRIPPIDLILMDMQMPIIDGLTATQRLRAEGYSLPIVALTANAMKEDRERCLAAGCDDFTTKPIDRATLYAVIARWLTAGNSTKPAESVLTS
jgi:PAS domain S-box-containing protein